MSYTSLADAIGGERTSTTYYSYDIHGNVDTLLQSYGKGVLNEVSGHMTKRIEYNYDFISGKVNQVSSSRDSQVPAITGMCMMQPATGS
ncbi:MAG: hypothetical protein BGO54_12160 [Sphingobacteriales bacterium 46-32]|nr:MAG: hypothetical protein BGO54_12160 [Sphingobacteriales bacterium 46-32]